MPEPSQPSSARPLLLVLVLSLVAWSGSIVRSGFSYDDHEVLDRNPVITGSLPWTAAFERDYWHHIEDAGHWRPAATLSLRIDHALWGKQPRGYHVTNVLLHLAALALAFAVLRAAGLHPRQCALGLLPFAIHPLLADAVAWVSGRTSMISALGGLLGCLLAARESQGARRPAVLLLAGFLGVGLALLGKEDGVVFAPLVVVLAARAGKRSALAAGGGSALAIVGWLAIRHAVLGAALAAPHATLAGESLGARMLVGGAALARGLLITAVPLSDPPGYRVSALRPESGGEVVVAVLAWCGLALVTALAAWTLLRRRPRALEATAALAVVGALLPHMQLIPSGEVLAPRFAYLPLLFGAPLVARLLGPLVAMRHGRGVLLALTLLAFGGAWQRAGVYADRASYWHARLPHEADQPMAWNALGNAYRNAKTPDLDKARENWLQAVAVDPRYSPAWVALGTLALEERDLAGAERALRRAVRVGTQNEVAFANLGVLFLRTDRFADAEKAYARATELSPGLLPAWRGLGRAHLGQLEYDEARAAFERALALDPRDRLTLELVEQLP